MDSPPLGEPPPELEPINLRHDHVGHHEIQVGCRQFGEVQRLAAVPRLQGPESLIPEHARDDAAEGVIILGDENRRRALATLRSVGHIHPVE